MGEVILALAFLVVAALLGQWLMPTTTAIITTPSVHGFAVGDRIVVNAQRARIVRIENATTMTIGFRQA